MIQEQVFVDILLHIVVDIHHEADILVVVVGHSQVVEDHNYFLVDTFLLSQIHNLDLHFSNRHEVHEDIREVQILDVVDMVLVVEDKVQDKVLVVLVDLDIVLVVEDILVVDKVLVVLGMDLVEDSLVPIVEVLLLFLHF